MPRKKNDTTPLPAPDPHGLVETETPPALPPAPNEPPELLLLDPYEIAAPEELNTRRFQTSRDSLLSLAVSMLSEGLQEPIGVTRMPDSTYLLRFGWRRWAAACMIIEEQLGMGILDGPYKLLAIVKPYTSPVKRQPPLEMLAGIAENFQRAEPGPVDQAYACKLLAATGMSHRNIAQKMNIDHTTVSRRLRLLDLPASTQRQVNAGEIPAEVAIRVLDQPEGAQREAAARAAEETTESAHGGVSDVDVRSGASCTNSGTDVSNKPTQTKEEKQVRSKTAKQMIVELEGYATPEEGPRTKAQTWVLTKLIPWIKRSGRPFRVAMEGLEGMAKGKE